MPPSSNKTCNQYQVVFHALKKLQSPSSVKWASKVMHFTSLANAKPNNHK